MLGQHGLFVLVHLELAYSVEQLHNSFRGNDLEFSLMLFVFNSRQVSAQEAMSLLLEAFLFQLILFPLFLSDLLRRALILRQDWLISLVLIELSIEDGLKSRSERVLEDLLLFVGDNPSKL